MALTKTKINLGTEGTLYGYNGGIGFSNPSDYRKKKNIKDLSDSLDKVNALRPVTFELKKQFGTEGERVGFIAHEVQEVMPRLVMGEKDGVMTEEDEDMTGSLDKAGDPKYQSVAYSDQELICRLVGSIQELSDKLDTANAKIEALENA